VIPTPQIYLVKAHIGFKCCSNAVHGFQVQRKGRNTTTTTTITTTTTTTNNNNNNNNNKTT